MTKTKPDPRTDEVAIAEAKAEAEERAELARAPDTDTPLSPQPDLESAPAPDDLELLGVPKFTLPIAFAGTSVGYLVPPESTYKEVRDFLASSQGLEIISQLATLTGNLELLERGRDILSVSQVPLAPPLPIPLESTTPKALADTLIQAQLDLSVAHMRQQAIEAAIAECDILRDRLLDLIFPLKIEIAALWIAAENRARSRVNAIQAALRPLRFEFQSLTKDTGRDPATQIRTRSIPNFSQLAGFWASVAPPGETRYPWWLHFPDYEQEGGPGEAITFPLNGGDWPSANGEEALITAVADYFLEAE